MLKNKKSTSPDTAVTDYRHADKRKNIPPAGLAAQGKVKEVPKARYFYDPHLPPILQFDSTGKEDAIPELLETARLRALTSSEAQMLADALRNRQPWLEWAGKREKAWFEVDPIALHIHERVSAQAIIKLAQRQPLQRSLFADPELEYRQAIQFYQHDMDWANRLILGDSLSVMHSLARREDLAGKMQMIYVDPPYGINFRSNFQPFVGFRDVKDQLKDLTREPEQIRAYRDTWTLGTHSYLSYLRDRLLIAKDLLFDEGSIFVQIGEANVHQVRALLDEVFGSNNFCRIITYVTTSFQADNILANVQNYLLWYAKDKDKVKVNRLFVSKRLGDDSANEYKWIMLPNGETRVMTEDEHSGLVTIPENARPWRHGPLTSQGWSETGSNPYIFRGRSYSPGNNQHWKSPIAMKKLERSDLLITRENSLAYYMFLDYFPISPITNVTVVQSKAIRWKTAKDCKIFIRTTWAKCCPET